MMVSAFEQPWTGRHLLITQRLRQRREELGLTQKQVVTRLGRVGVLTTNRALSSLEHGSGLDIAKLPEISRALDCTITYLVGLTDDPHRWAPDAQVTPEPRPAKAAVPADPSVPATPASHASCILGADIPERIRRFS
jgi:transcriptional regulator with XRE-family HTH domain